ncbi:hypothetical protein BHE74_00020076 [Ensete ventricosum]|nr:hypothetical protein BHE74_00020076 [Ensete ventricosum]
MARDGSSIPLLWHITSSSTTPYGPLRPSAWLYLLTGEPDPSLSGHAPLPRPRQHTPTYARPPLLTGESDPGLNSPAPLPRPWQRQEKPRDLGLSSPMPVLSSMALRIAQGTKS